MMGMNEMLTKVKKALARVIKNESGQAALIAVLILLLLGALMIPPLLGLMSTGLKAGQAHESRLQEFYAADGGLEDALYRAKHDDNLPPDMRGTWTDADYAAGSEWIYPDPSDPLGIDPDWQINSRDVTVTIQPFWYLEGLEDASEFENEKTPPNTPPEEQDPEHAFTPLNLIVFGDVIELDSSPDPPTGKYQIAMDYDSYSTAGQLKIDRIGAWLPPGFDYIAGSSNLETYLCQITTADYKSGTAIIWDFNPNIHFTDLPPFSPSSTRRVVTFQFTTPPPFATLPYGSFSWIKVVGTESDDYPDNYLAWDVGCKFFQVTSKAEDASGKSTTVKASVPRSEFIKYASGVEGDYHAIGSTLMRDHDDEGCGGCRERLYKETSASTTSSDIPSNANVDQIRLYWSAWKNDPWNVWTMSEAGRLALPATYKVNQVTLKVKLDEVEVGGSTYYDDEVSLPVTADSTQVLGNGSSWRPHGWTYSCFADVTEDLKQAYRNKYGAGDDTEVSFSGQGIYTLGHAFLADSGTDLYGWEDDHEDEEIVDYTDYPLGDWEGENNLCWWCSQDEWAYAAWSIIIVYSSPTSKGHMLYLDDNFRYTDNDETQVFNISNFLAPQDVITDPNAARLTCFVAEGDEWWPGDELQFKSESGTGYYSFSDDVNPQDNVWNSKSNVLPGITIDGVDIDTFSVQYPYIKPGDTEATVKMPTQTDSWNLVYIVLSFRSEITIGGTISYRYETG